MEYVYIIIEEHHALGTRATTFFEIDGDFKEIYRTGNTHVKRYLKIIRGSKIKGYRYTNNGRFRTKTFVIDKPVFIDFTLNARELSDFEIQCIKAIEELQK